MIDEILDTVQKYVNEKVKLTKGAVAVIAAGSFLIGLITGVCAARMALGKTIRRLRSSCRDDFDADEYVRNLNFEDEN